MMRIFLVVFLGALLFSCGYSNEETQTFDQQIKQHIQKKNLNLKPTGSGLYLSIDSLGKGRKIQLQDSIWVKYQLFLLSGERIEKQDKAIGLPLIGIKHLGISYVKGLNLFPIPADNKIAFKD